MALKNINYKSYKLLITFVVVFAVIGTYLIFSSFASSTSIASTQAEQMTLPAGSSIVSDATASGGQAVKMTQAGSLTGSVNLPSSSTSLSVRAESNKCNGGYSDMKVQVDGNVVLPAIGVKSTTWLDMNSTSFSLPSGTHNLKITFTNPNLRCNHILYVDVTNFFGPTTLPPAPTVSFSATPTTLTAGQSATLTWTSTNTTSCAASGAWSGPEPTYGSVSTGALNTNVTYTLTCNGGGGTASGVVYITVNSGSGGGTGGPGPIGSAETSPITTWASCSPSFTPMSDSAAAALITPIVENRSMNVTANNYVPTDTELANFQAAKNQYNQTTAQQNPYDKYVDGRDGITNPSTDDLIQWGAHKWGIPEDWLRAEYVQESYWRDTTLGDEATVSSTWYNQYPVQARVPNSLNVYESMGLTQVKWRPDNSVGIGTEPLRWGSTAFNIDFQAAAVRFYYDNPGGIRSAWGDSSYQSCQQWNSIGGWFSPYPWANSGQESYINSVQSVLSNRTWAQSGF